MNELFKNPILCSRCILPSTFPGIKFDDQGVCNYCRRDEPMLKKSSEKKAQYRLKLDDLVRKTKTLDSGYDVIAAYSGGKDSSYTLKLLHERYSLKILALTLDNHFIPLQTRENIKKVTDTLGIDHITFRPKWRLMKSIFILTANRDIYPLQTLTRASSICTACIGLVKSITLKAALEMKIPLVAFGWSPGQAPVQSAIMKTNASLVRESQKALLRAMPEEIVHEMKSYFIPDRYFAEYDHHFPTNVHPLAFFDYDEEVIKREIEALGWKAPTNTDSNSTNCQLNAFANQCHIRRRGFHPYVWEIANMVRQGVMKRQDGVEKIYQDQNPQMVSFAKEKLGL